MSEVCAAANTRQVPDLWLCAPRKGICVNIQDWNGHNTMCKVSNGDGFSWHDPVKAFLSLKLCPHCRFSDIGSFDSLQIAQTDCIYHRLLNTN